MVVSSQSAVRPDMLYTWIVVLVVGSITGSWGQEGPLVQTDKGPVRGTTETLNGETYDRFLSIPFAKPAEGLLRFAKTEPAEPWTDELIADEFGPHCPHFIANFYNFIGVHNVTGEDCLHLSVWVPGGVNAADNLPVMFFYYGGAFLLGTHAMYPGEELALHGGVIMVGFNYRLNNLGFLSTGDESCPGNFGLWDAREALTWVQNNIAAFGGDPDRVTIFGQSAGASLVSHSVVSPQMDGLFKAAIPISGGSTGFLGVVDPLLARETAETTGSIFRCGHENTQELIDCLREQDADALSFWGSISDVLFNNRLPSYLPALDGDMIPIDPLDAWVDPGPANEVDLIMGSTHHDSAGFVLLNVLGGNSSFAHDGGVCSNNDTLDLFLNIILNRYGNRDDLKAYLFERYPGIGSDDSETCAIALTECTTDYMFSSSPHYEPYFNSQYDKNTYVYDFHYRQSFFQYPGWVEGSHLDDLYSVFGEVFMQNYREDSLMAGYSDEDKITSEIIMNYYTNFAHTGNPNNGPHRVPLDWEEYDPENRRYIVLNDAPYMTEPTQEELDEYYHWKVEWPRELVDPYIPNNETGPTLPEGCEPGFPPDLDCISEILPDLPIDPPFPFPPRFPQSDSESEWQQFETDLEISVEQIKEIFKMFLPEDEELMVAVDEVFAWGMESRGQSIANRLSK